MQVVRVIVLTLRNLLPKAACGAQMIDLGLPQIVQSQKAQAWSDEVTFMIPSHAIFGAFTFKTIVTCKATSTQISDAAD